MTLTVPAADYLAVATTLRDDADLAFEQLIDLCGVDYEGYKDGALKARVLRPSPLMSVIRTGACAQDLCHRRRLPLRPSVNGVWPLGQLVRARGLRHVRHHFRRPSGPAPHPDRLRLHRPPDAQDFPVSGHVEMRYDPEQRRVVYQPVTIEPREITPRVIREDNYGGL